MLTTIHDIVTYFDGSIATGRIVVTWPPFIFGGVAVAGGQQVYPIGPDGSVTVICYPSIGAQPLGTYYTATYELDRGPVYDEYWLVPAIPQTTIGAVRASFPATPSIMINPQQLSGGTALPGQFLGWNGANWVPMFPSGQVALAQGAAIPRYADLASAQAALGTGTQVLWCDPTNAVFVT